MYVLREFGGANMFENNQRMTEWDSEDDYEHVKKVILNILKNEKVSLSKIRTLFNGILNDIEDRNPINF